MLPLRRTDLAGALGYVQSQNGSCRTTWAYGLAPSQHQRLRSWATPNNPIRQLGSMRRIHRPDRPILVVDNQYLPPIEAFVVQDTGLTISAGKSEEVMPGWCGVELRARCGPDLQTGRRPAIRPLHRRGNTVQWYRPGRELKVGAVWPAPRFAVIRPDRNRQADGTGLEQDANPMAGFDPASMLTALPAMGR